jgi:hypothetical protein
MEVVCSSETQADFQRTTWRYIPDDDKYSVEFLAGNTWSEQNKDQLMLFTKMIAVYSENREEGTEKQVSRNARNLVCDKKAFVWQRAHSEFQSQTLPVIELVPLT